jgi:hypothetical protein
MNPTEKQIDAGYAAILPDMDKLTETFVPAGDIPFVGNVRDKIHTGIRSDATALWYIRDAVRKAWIAMQAKA